MSLFPVGWALNHLIPTNLLLPPAKSEIRISKFETNPNCRNLENWHANAFASFGHFLSFLVCFGFRASDFLFLPGFSLRFADHFSNGFHVEIFRVPLWNVFDARIDPVARGNVIFRNVRSERALGPGI